MAINNTLSYGNAAKASTPAISPLSGSALSNALAKGLGSNLSIGSTGTVTAKKTPTTSGTSIASTTKTTPVTSGSVSSGSSSAGAYKGYNLTGSDSDIASAISRIDAGTYSPAGAGSTSSSTSKVGGLLTPPTPPSGATSGMQAPSYSGLVSTILDRSSKSSKEVQSAYDAQQKANENLEHFRESAAETKQGIYSSPTSARVMQGRNAAVQQANSEKEAALGSQLESATGMYQNALTGQGQQLNALTSTLGQVAPTVGAYGQTYYDPLNQSSSGDASGITGGWANFLASGGDPSQVPAAVSGNPVLWQQTLSAAKQQNPSFDVNTSLGAAAGRQSNASTAGSAIINTAAQGYQQTTQNYNQMTAVNSAAHTQSQNLVNILNKTGINANDPTLFNKGLNTLQRNFSSTDYASFTTALAELQNMYGQLLQTGGGTPTGNEQQALNVLNANSSAAAIGAAISQLEQASYAKLQAQYNQANNYLQQLNGGGQSGGGTSSGGGLYNW